MIRLWKLISKDACYINIRIKNVSDQIAFFTQLQLLDVDSKPICPSFYSDNFYSFLPKENKVFTIETAKNNMRDKKIRLVMKGWNIKPQVFGL